MVSSVLFLHISAQVVWYHTNSKKSQQLILVLQNNCDIFFFLCSPQAIYKDPFRGGNHILVSTSLLIISVYTFSFV